MNIRGRHLLLFAFVLAACCAAFAGGPLMLSSSGAPLVWRTFPVSYRVDSGAMSINKSGKVKITHAQGVARVNSMFANWSNVPTAAISYANAGPLLGVAGGDAKTVGDLNTLFSSCSHRQQNPIIFDANGSILTGLFGAQSGVIGFSSVCAVDPNAGTILSAMLLMDGEWQDLDPSNGELSSSQFDEAITHEIGHLSGLGHSQINIEVLFQPEDFCSTTDLAGLPLMFPFAHCQTRPSPLSPDDMAWISFLYPVATTGGGKTAFTSVYGIVTGTIFFSDGKTPVQGANVIARQVGNPRAVAVSSVSGYQFTGNLGQSITSNYLQCAPASQCPPRGFLDDNTGGDVFGGRAPGMLGSYQMPVPGGNQYTIEAESVFGAFTAGSSVGPLDPPIPIPGSAATSSPFSVTAGTTGPAVDLTLSNTPQILDGFEGSLLLIPDDLRAIHSSVNQERGL